MARILYIIVLILKNAEFSSVGILCWLLVSPLASHSQAISCSIVRKIDGMKICISFVYGKNSSEEWRQLWDHLMSEKA